MEVCPTGVFTDATLKRHYTRKWDLQMAPSICVHCSLGCNITAGERYGMLRRIVNRYNEDINGYFLCDRGRYGYEFVNSDQRIREPLLLPESLWKPLRRARISAQVYAVRVGRSASVLRVHPLNRTSRCELLVGAENFYAGVSDQERQLLMLMIQILRTGPARAASLADVEASDAVLILGEDVTNTAPRMALTLRQSVRQQPIKAAVKLHIPVWLDHSVRNVVQDSHGPMFIASASATRLDDVATRTYRGAPDDIARLGFAVAHALDAAAPDVTI